MNNLKFLLLLPFIVWSMNSWALWGFFESSEKKIDPASLKDYEERMNYMLNHDPVFKKYWDERKAELKSQEERDRKELEKIEKDMEFEEKYTPEYRAKIKAERESKRQEEFSKKMKEAEKEIAKEWKVVNGEFVNIKEEKEKKEKEKKDAEALRRIQQFQSEEGLPISKDIEEVNINVD